MMEHENIKIHSTQPGCKRKKYHRRFEIVQLRTESCRVKRWNNIVTWIILIDAS